jgi:hypothetical protein
MWAAGMQQLSVQFAKGDRHARHDAFWIAERLGSEFLTPKKAFDESLAGDRQAILDAYVARQTHRKVSAAPSPVFAPPELLDDDTPDEADESFPNFAQSSPTSRSSTTKLSSISASHCSSAMASGVTNIRRSTS